MRKRNIWLIFQRELRDQLRDRRTLFSIMILPLLLYPLMGGLSLQLTHFFREQRSKIRVMTSDDFDRTPKLFADRTHFAESWCPSPEAKLLELSDDLLPESGRDLAELTSAARREIRDNQYDLLLYFPPDFGQSLEKFQERVRREREVAEAGDGIETSEVPAPVILSDQANDRSKLALRRIELILSRWRSAVIGETLKQNKVSIVATAPFDVRKVDVAEDRIKRAVVWSRLMPFMILIWSITGAFYPAVDLCAGEKERGTMETLLSGPASRTEVVLGKLLTICSFSILTALLNMVSLGITGALFLKPMTSGGNGLSFFAAPPALAYLWVFVGMIPVALLFSALSLAIASFARSTKEGQYYLLPLLFAALPLLLAALIPSVELNFGTSIIPVTGPMLLMRTLIDERYLQAARYTPLVLGVTFLSCYLACRWAIEQFNNEEVLFRESERFQLGHWLRRAWRDRKETPQFSAALLGTLTILLVRLAYSFSASKLPAGWTDFWQSTVLNLGLFFGLGACLLALVFSTSLRRTLSLRGVSWKVLLLGPLLAAVVHPLGIAAAAVVQQVYSMNEQLAEQLQKLEHIFTSAPNLGALILVLAVTPGICEELMFRGFTLSGLRSKGHDWLAIVISSLLFGVAHQVLQQSITACLLGLILGYLVTRCGSIWPAMLFHATYNTLSLLLVYRAASWSERFPPLNWLLQQQTTASGQLAVSYRWPVIVISFVLMVGIFGLDRRRRFVPTENLEQP